MRISGLRDNSNINTQNGLDGYLVFKSLNVSKAQSFGLDIFLKVFDVT